MASEKAIKNVLDLLTTAPENRIESLAAEPKSHARTLKQKIGSKNVVAIGISEKITKRKRTGKLALTFYVEKKIPLSKMKASEIIPVAVAEALRGNTTILTDVIAIGKLRPQVNVTRQPVQPGFSIGHVRITAGTLGAIVTDGKENYILSNSHVLARSGKAQKGDAIIYPGKFDGGKNPKDLIANLHAFTPFTTGGSFVNVADCAIAKPIKERLAELNSKIKGIGFPKGTIKPKRGMKVVKVGRTTGKTEGEIKDVHFRFILKYDEGVGDVGYIDQVLCTRYTDGGDSGSLVIDKKTGRAVGLHFAGADGGSVFNPIDKVLSSLGVKLVTKALK